jgi:hypothetical protein
VYETDGQLDLSKNLLKGKIRRLLCTEDKEVREKESGLTPTIAEIQYFSRVISNVSELGSKLPTYFDAIGFFGNVEKRAIEFINTQSDGISNFNFTIVMRQYHWDCLAGGHRTALQGEGMPPEMPKFVEED